MVVRTPVRSISARKKPAKAPSVPTTSFWTCTATTAVRVGSKLVMVVRFLRVDRSGASEDRGADVGDVALGGERVGQEDRDHVATGLTHELGLLQQVVGAAVEAPVVDELLGDQGPVDGVETAQVLRPHLEVLRGIRGV